jgi:LPS-assembly lipoprotein
VFDAMPPPGAATPADAVLDVLADQREKSVVGSTAAGQVREFQLRTRFRFRLSTPAGKVLIEDSEILLQRDISYSETLALSKADEEAALYRDMQTDIVQQLLRRLAAVRSL